jgi:hypothetical protein
MQKNIQLVYTAQTAPAIQEAVNALERIGAAERDKWEPYYYAAFGYLMIANRETSSEVKDRNLDRATVAVEKAREINPGESEIVALEGFVVMIRIAVDPTTRGRQYSGAAMQLFGKAMAMNPENPRALALMAQMQYGTSKFFGSSTADACGVVDRALLKFDTFTSENPLAPQWGREMTQGLKAECQ